MKCFKAAMVASLISFVYVLPVNGAENETLSGSQNDSSGRNIALNGTVEQTMLNLTPRTGVKHPSLLLEPKDPKYYHILFVGGQGKAKCGDEFFKSTTGTNFLARTRLDYVNAGASVVFYCAPDDRWGGKGLLVGNGKKHYRTSNDFILDFTSLVNHLKSIKDMPVVVNGTSFGSKAALFIAERKPDLVDILIMSSVATVPHNNQPELMLSEMNAEKVTQPTLLLAHKKDRCKFTPISGVEKLLKLIGSGTKKLIMIEGGKPPKGSDNCKSYTPHGFYGIEAKTATETAKFIAENL